MSYERLVRKEKNLEIEQLRAVAIVLVFVAHVPLLSPFIGEFISPFFRYFSFGVGVDLFFCISGYVVASSCCEYFDNYRKQGLFWPAARGFWARRAWRLLPSAWLWVLIGVVCSVAFNSSGFFSSLEDNLRSALVIAVFSANIADIYGWLAPNNVYWSLALEEQFYFVFPIFLLWVTGPRARVLILLLIIAMQFPVMRSHFGDLTAQYFAIFRVDGFAWGVLVFMFSRGANYIRFEPRFLYYKPAALLVSLLLIYLMVAVPAVFSGYSAMHGMLSAITAVIVWLASYSRNYTFGYTMLRGVVVWIGARSYAIYLIHIPVFKITNESLFRYITSNDLVYSVEMVPWQLFMAVFLILLMADLNYRYVEEPMRRLGAARVRARLPELVVDKGK